MKPSELNAGYTKMMGELRDLILRTQPKRLGNTDEEMTGETLANFIVGLIPEVNKGTLYMGDRVVEGIAKGLLEKCKREYTRETQKIALPVEAAELETYSLAAKELSMRCFEDGMVGRADSYVKALYRTMLEDENQLTYDFLKENNTYHSMGLCAKVTKLTNEKTMKSERVGTAHDGYIDEVVAAAASMLRGPKKAQCLEDIRSNVIEILNNKKISLVPARIDVLIKNIITIGAVLYVFASYTKFRLMWSLVWLVGVLGVLLASYKFNFFSLLTRDQVVAILDTYDEACYIVATYWQALPFAAILLLLVAFLFRPRRPADAVRVLGARVKKECVAQDKADGSGSGNGIVCVQFWRNCTNNGKAVKEVARKITRKDKIIVLIGWRHYLGLSFLPRSRSAHIVCSGGADVNVDDVRDVFERAKGLIAGNTDDYDDDYENGSSRRSGKHRSGESTKPYIIYAYNVETSAFLLPPDREIKSELESSDIFSGSKSDQDSD